MLADAPDNITAAVILVFTAEQGCWLLADPECQDTVTTAGRVMTLLTIMSRFLGHAEQGSCRASLVLPKQPGLGIPVSCIDMTVQSRNATLLNLYLNLKHLHNVETCL